jgi:hypothetical protein
VKQTLCVLWRWRGIFGQFSWQNLVFNFLSEIFQYLLLFEQPSVTSLTPACHHVLFFLSLLFWQPRLEFIDGPTPDAIQFIVE